VQRDAGLPAAGQGAVVPQRDRDLLVARLHHIVLGRRHVYPRHRRGIPRGLGPLHMHGDCQRTHQLHVHAAHHRRSEPRIDDFLFVVVRAVFGHRLVCGVIITRLLGDCLTPDATSLTRTIVTSGVRMQAEITFIPQMAHRYNGNPAQDEMNHKSDIR